MLIFKRCEGERIVCREFGIVLTVFSTHAGYAKIGIEAPPEMCFDREEIALAKEREGQAEFAQAVQRVA